MEPALPLQIVFTLEIPYIAVSTCHVRYLQCKDNFCDIYYYMSWKYFQNQWKEETYHTGLDCQLHWQPAPMPSNAYWEVYTLHVQGSKNLCGMWQYFIGFYGNSYMKISSWSSYLGFYMVQLIEKQETSKKSSEQKFCKKLYCPEYIFTTFQCSRKDQFMSYISLCFR